MASKNAPERKTSGTTDPAEPIWLPANPSSSSRTIHASPDCPRLANTEPREKQYQHRPLRAEWCPYCTDDEVSE